MVLLFEGSLRAIPFNVFLGLLLAVDLAYNQVPSLLISIWFAIIVVVSTIRSLFCYHALKKNRHLEKKQFKMSFFIILTLLMGIVWGACYWLMLPYVDNLHEFIIILVLGGMCAGAIASLSAYLPAYYAYILPMFLPIIIYNYSLLNLERTFLATMFLLFVLMVSISAKINNNLLNKMFRLSKERESLIKKLELLSTTDSLTGLYNRRHFESILQKELRRANRTQSSLSLVLIDIDNFKSSNDRFGHPYGDTVLIKAANLLQATFRRAQDTVFRLGGDEFSVLLVDQTIQDIIALCETLNKSISSEITNIQEKETKKTTLSIGIVFIPASYHISNDDLLNAVDQALYKAKKAGKNRIVTTELGSNQRTYVIESQNSVKNLI